MKTFILLNLIFLNFIIKSEECAPIDYDLGERNILFPSEQALGIPIQKSQPLFLHGGRIESLIDTDDLRCSDFDESCQWYNIENSELSWLRGRIHLDSQHMKIAAGTEIVPKGLYAVVVTDRQMFPNAKAVLASKVIECQQGIGQLRLNYWVSTGVRISVCAKRTGKRYPDFDICTDLDPGNIPGPAYVNIQDFEHQPFQIFIRANNFIYDSASLKGGFAIVDNIEYYADLCTNSLDKVPQRDEFFKFFDSPFSESTSSAKPKELIIKKIVESSNRSDFEQNSERIEPVNLIDNEVTNFPSHSSLVAVMQQIPMNSTKKISKTAKKLYVVENTDIISYPTNPQTNSVTMSPTFLRKPCDVLSCTFMEENCTGYINGTGWLIYNGTKSNSSVLDNLLMENNNEVSFLYIIGPIATSRLLIPSFTSAFNFHLILTYNVHPKSSKLRAYAKLLNEAHERKIFQSSRLRTQFRQWRQTAIHLQKGIYEYIAFEVKNLLDDEIVAIGKIRIYEEEEICHKN